MKPFIMERKKIDAWDDNTLPSQSEQKRTDIHLKKVKNLNQTYMR